MQDIKFACPECNRPLVVDADAGGRKVNCPACSNPLLIPPGALLMTPHDKKAVIVFNKQLLKKTIQRISIFTFLDLPRSLRSLFVLLIPWMVRLLRIMLYVCIWIILAFGPFIITSCIMKIEHSALHRAQWFIYNRSHLIANLGYVWVAICLAGLFWRITKWASLRKAQNAKAKLPHRG
jgi:hypothetical protein